MPLAILRWRVRLRRSPHRVQPHTSLTNKIKRPLNAKQQKEDLGNVKTHEEASHAQAQAYLRMARATYLTAQTLQDTTT